MCHSIAIVRYFEVLGAVLECHEANFETGDGYRVARVCGMLPEDPA